MIGREANTRACDTVADRTAQIAELNDDLRCGTGSGRVAVTAGILALGSHVLPTIMLMVQEFDDFGTDNDPYGEHDFGALDWNGHRIFWKIDYYDLAMTGGSPDPADPSVTTRVLTVMLASDY